MVWFRRHIRRPDKGLFMHYRRDLGTGRAYFGRPVYDPPKPIRPAWRRFYKCCAAKRQRFEDRRRCRLAALDPAGPD